MYPVCGRIFCRFFALADSSSRGLWNTFFSDRPSVVRHLRLSCPSLLDPADNICDEVSSRIQYKKSLVVASGFHVYQQFSCQVREPSLIWIVLVSLLFTRQVRQVISPLMEATSCELCSLGMRFRVISPPRPGDRKLRFLTVDPLAIDSALVWRRQAPLRQGRGIVPFRSHWLRVILWAPDGYGAATVPWFGTFSRQFERCQHRRVRRDAESTLPTPSSTSWRGSSDDAGGVISC